MAKGPKPQPLTTQERELLGYFRACTPERRQLLWELSKELCRANPKIEIHVVTGSETQ